MSYQLNTNHPLPQREQTYLLDRKILTIHSEDRDINKYPNANEFEITLPQDIQNIYSMRLLEINLPNTYYSFTNSYQNTKFIFELEPLISGGGSEYTALFTKFNSSVPNNFFTLEINEGYYSATDLASELTCKLNETVTNELINNYGLPSTYSYDKFSVIYDRVQHKFIFLNNRDKFYFNFDLQVGYNNIPCNQKIVFEQYTNWGLPHNLGYEKNSYIAESSNTFELCYDNYVLTPDVSSSVQKVWSIKSPNILDIEPPGVIYVDLDKYNNIDELEPYSSNTSGLYNNDYGGKTNSSFARIPLSRDPYNRVFKLKSGAVGNIYVFKSPLMKLRRMKFDFRFHDGRKVEFKNKDFSFCIEFNTLLDEQERNFVVRVPPFYGL